MHRRWIVDSSNVVQLGDSAVAGVNSNVATGASHTRQINGSTQETLNATGLSLAGVLTSGTNPADAGQLRLPNNTGLYARNAANGGNVAAVLVDASDRVVLRGSVYVTGDGVGVGTTNPTFVSGGQAVTVEATGDTFPGFVMRRVSF